MIEGTVAPACLPGVMFTPRRASGFWGGDGEAGTPISPAIQLASTFMSASRELKAPLARPTCGFETAPPSLFSQLLMGNTGTCLAPGLLQK